MPAVIPSARRYFVHQLLAVAVLLLSAATPVLAAAPPPEPSAARLYDPLAASDPGPVGVLDLTVRDARRSREIPLRIYLPAARAAAPVVLFSHGLGGSREGSAYLGRHWASRGYIAVFLQHHGSDSGVWQDKPQGQRLSALRQAGNLRNFLLRAQDVPATIDQLDHWNRTSNHPLRARLDLTRLGMSGHSFGALTTQAVAGERLERVGTGLVEPRIKAALVMSPSPPWGGGDPGMAFGKITLPWLLMTGTRDSAPLGESDPAARLKVYPALPAGGKYELVLDGALHSAFTENDLPGESGARNPSHHRAIRAISTAFWDSWLRNDAAARAWLDGPGPRQILEPVDRWQKK